MFRIKIESLMDIECKQLHPNKRAKGRNEAQLDWNTKITISWHNNYNKTSRSAYFLTFGTTVVQIPDPFLLAEFLVLNFILHLMLRNVCHS